MRATSSSLCCLRRQRTPTQSWGVTMSRYKRMAAENGSKGREPGTTPQCPRAGLAAGMSQEPRAAGMRPAQGGYGQGGVRSGLVGMTKARHSPVPEATGHRGRKFPPSGFGVWERQGSKGLKPQQPEDCSAFPLGRSSVSAPTPTHVSAAEQGSLAPLQGRDWTCSPAPVELGYLGG